MAARTIPNANRLASPLTPPVRLHGTDAAFASFEQCLATDTRFDGLEPERLTLWWRVMFFDQHKGNCESALKAVERTLVSLSTPFLIMAT